MLKYKREGLAYQIWRMGSMNRAAFSTKAYPEKMKDFMPELFEKPAPVALPDWLKDDYEGKINETYRQER